VIRQSEINAQMDALNIRYRGQLERKQYIDQGNLDAYYAKVYKQNANNSIWGGFLGAGTSLLSSASEGYQKGIFK
jgi:hypothetical protein